MPNRSGVKVISSSIKGTKFSYGDEQYTIAMAGEHQVINALCALECIKVLTVKGIKIPIEAVKDGLARAQICARGEVIGENPLVILDGAHNPSGMEAAKSLLSAGNAPRVAVLGMLKDKLVEKSLSVILPALDGVVLVDGYSQREMAADELVELAKACDIEAHSMPFSEKAMELAKSLAGENGTVLVAGSLYLASAVKSMQKNKKK